MTAVEYIQQEFLKKLTDENYQISFNKIIEQAKAMEKSQITDAYIMGSYDMAEKEFRPEEYYNEVYGGEGTPDTSSPNIKNK
jgi:HEPN domain-containing protein